MSTGLGDAPMELKGFVAIALNKVQATTVYVNVPQISSTGMDCNSEYQVVMRMTSVLQGLKSLTLLIMSSAVKRFNCLFSSPEVKTKTKFRTGTTLASCKTMSSENVRRSARRTTKQISAYNVGDVIEVSASIRFVFQTSSIHLHS